MKTIFRILLAALIFCAPETFAQKPLAAEDIPIFEMRLKAVSIEGKAPGADSKIKFLIFALSHFGFMESNEWTEWTSFTKEGCENALNAYPNSQTKAWPVHISMWVYEVESPMVVELETRFKADGPVTKTTLELDKGNLTFQIRKDEQGKFHIEKAVPIVAPAPAAASAPASPPAPRGRPDRYIDWPCTTRSDGPATSAPGRRSPSGRWR